MISLVATVYNERKNIEEFVRSITYQSVPPGEVVMVDGGSTDGTLEFLEGFEWIRLISDPTCNIKHCNSPVARGRNIAIAHTKGDIIAITDAGCVLHRLWLENITKPLDDPEITVVAGWFYPLAETRFAKIVSAFRPSPEEVLNTPSSRSLAMRRYVWESVGGYPEVSLTAEDTALDKLIHYRKFTHALAEDAIVYWRVSPNLKHFIRQNYRYSKGDAICSLRSSMHAEIALRFASIALAFHFDWWLGAGLAALYYIYLLFVRDYIQTSIWTPAMKLVMDGAKLYGYIVGKLKRLFHKSW